MALDVASLTLDDSQASLASMPEELWRKIGGYLDNCGSDERFVRVLLASVDTEDIDMEEVLMARVQKFASSIMTLYLSTRTFRSRHGEPPPAADEPEGRLEALARRFAADKPEGGLEAFARQLM